MIEILLINFYARFFKTLKELHVDELTRNIVRHDANVNQIDLTPNIA